jgi:amino acid adenylation domain-containing protein
LVRSYPCAAAMTVHRPLCILPSVQRYASIRPEAIAVRTKSQQFTYRELNELMNRLAISLRRAGVQRGALVGVLMNRSPECLAALLGIWKAGAAYLALDPISPPERLAFMLQDAEVEFVIAEEKLVSLLPERRLRVLYGHDLLFGQIAEPAEPEFAAAPDDLAYVLYTSGSTGKPKGVEVCHHSLANVIAAVAEELQLASGEVLLAHTSLGFDVSNLELYLPLVSGGSVYFAETGRVGDGVRLMEALADSGASTMLGTCTLWRLLLDAGWEGNINFRAISGGEVLSLELAKALSRRTGALWNHYGPTEATICATTARIHSTAEKITIGRPISNVTVHVLDSSLRPVAEQAAGELYIGGTGVARGYRNRPDLTKASFLADPFSPEAGARLYRTGDLARRLPDGCLEFLGRIDQQVKIHGYRIELEEIEEQIRQFPEIIDAAVAALDRGKDDQRIVAWFESKGSILPSELRAFLKQRLPAYMVPSEFRRLRSMPLNESGKLDRKSLESQVVEVAATAHFEIVAGPETGSESALRSVWEDLLQIRPVALTDNFFDLGGDSLLAALLVAQVKRRFGQTITPDMLAECPTVKSLSARILALENRAGRALVSLRAEGGKPPLFLIPGLGGSVLLFRALVARLDAEQPVYGVALPSGIVKDRTEVEVKTLAAKYIEEIRAICPAGPYQIGGHSFGALIAFEMAAQLTNAGEQVGLLALIDGDRYFAQRFEEVFEDPATPSLVLRRYQAKLKSLMQKGATEVFRRRVEYIKLRKRVKLAQKAAESDFSTGAFDAKEMMAGMAKDYNPVPAAVSAVLLRAGDEVRSSANHDLGWSGLARQGLDIVEIPGQHLTIFDEPNVDVLAAALTKRLSTVVALECDGRRTH